MGLQRVRSLDDSPISNIPNTMPITKEPCKKPDKQYTVDTAINDRPIEKAPSQDHVTINGTPYSEWETKCGKCYHYRETNNIHKCDPTTA